MRCLILLVAVLFGMGCGPARLGASIADGGSAGKNAVLFDEGDAELAEKEAIREQAAAAAYRLARARGTPSPNDEAAALRYLVHGRALLRAARTSPGPDDTPDVVQARRGTTFPEEDLWADIGLVQTLARRAGRLARDGMAAHGFSSHAAALVLLRLEAYAHLGELDEVRTSLTQLWYWLPDADCITTAMRIALEAAEAAQAFETRVDLSANDPAQVVRIDGASRDRELNLIFRFLARYGDRRDVAPRASLGLARSLLRGGYREDLYHARRLYEDFLGDYPEDPRAFTALTELALSHLIVYRGDRYDVGALIAASAIIDQAELESAGDPAKVKTIAAYRARIRSWHQDRDLMVARWYRARRAPWGWFNTPPGLDDWVAGARLYYREVIRRDPLSEQGRSAERELAELPPAAPAPAAR